MRNARGARLIGYLRPYRRPLLLGMLTMLAESLIALLPPWLAGQFTAALLPDQGAARFGVHAILLLWLAALALLALLRFFNGLLFTRTGARVMTDLSRRMHEHLQHLPLRFHQQHSSGELLALLGSDVATIGQFVAGPIANLLPLAVTLLGAAVMLIAIDPLIGAIVLLVAPLFILLVKLLARSVRPLARRVADQRATMLATADETLRLLPIVKSFTQEPRRRADFHRDSGEVRRLLSRQLRIQALLGPLMQFLAATLMLGLLWLASWRVEQGALSAPALVSLLMYGFLLVRPISGFASLYGEIQQARGAFERIDEVMAEQPEPIDHGDLDPGRVAGAIRFEGVAFGYPGRPPLYRDLELDIAAGETIVVTGENGAGKSTLAYLLLRFEQPLGGTIRLDGVPLDDYALPALRRQIGYVPQQVSIANGTVRDNIVFGVPEADDAAVREAARLAQADVFIDALPEGYATRVGDDGVRLSGGQRQRLALARALLLDPPILILDEATATFDPAGEQELITRCREIFAHRTVIVITHRPALLALATRRFVLEGGRLRELADR